KAAYSGIEGSFAHIATKKIVPEAETLHFKIFKDAYEATVSGKSDVTILPIENSMAGEVGQVMDMLFTGPLCVEGIYELPVTHCLLGVKGSKLENITQVISHPQALEQCEKFIESKKLLKTSFENTARAAREVANRKDKTVAAIASEETAKLYGLKVLKKAINDSKDNTTRFAVLKRKEDVNPNRKDHDSFILLFTVKHEAGALARAIGVLALFGYNMRVIRSRSLKKRNWQYYFYTEIEGKPDTKNGQKMLKILKGECKCVKVLGTYKPGCVLK
ncbi:MAG: bifunctional chorismate mutase/prephenate dehydratase, partial [Lachnospiraceae bacterium]|nr:bifunctional chorismate mutase/prephenate dehydratase [Lachnospiraceae bacterium]